MASFCGGGVGVLTALLIVEANNAKMQVWAAVPWPAHLSCVALCSRGLLLILEAKATFWK